MESLSSKRFVMVVDWENPSPGFKYKKEYLIISEYNEKYYVGKTTDINMAFRFLESDITKTIERATIHFSQPTIRSAGERVLTVMTEDDAYIAEFIES